MNYGCGGKATYDLVCNGNPIKGLIGCKHPGMKEHERAKKLIQLCAMLNRNVGYLGEHR